MHWVIQLLYIGCPLLLINTVLYVFLHKENEIMDSNDKHQVHFKIKGGSLKLITSNEALQLLVQQEAGKLKVWFLISFSISASINFLV